MKPTILLISILLIGCTPIIEKECEPIFQEKIVYQNITIYRNRTDCIKDDICLCNVTSSNERELELIRRLKFLEGQTDKYFNDSECNDDLNRTENKLKECEEELCEYNSSWC